jgi:hypothetical protein
LQLAIAACNCRVQLQLAVGSLIAACNRSLQLQLAVAACNCSLRRPTGATARFGSLQLQLAAAVSNYSDSFSCRFHCQCRIAAANLLLQQCSSLLKYGIPPILLLQPLQPCSPAALQPCSPAALQPCSPAAQPCSPALQLCSLAVVCSRLQPSSPAALQFCSPAAVCCRLLSSATLQPAGQLHAARPERRHKKWQKSGGNIFVSQATPSPSLAPRSPLQEKPCRYR